MPLTYLFTSFSVKDKPLKKIQNTYAQSTITVPIHLKSDMCDYVHSPTPHAKYGGRRKWGVGWAYGWSCTLACLFFIYFFWFLQCVHSLPWEAWIFAQCIQNVFRWWVCSFGVDLPRGSNLPFFCPQKPFFNGPNNIFCMGVNRKHPLWLMIAP